MKKRKKLKKREKKSLDKEFFQKQALEKKQIPKEKPGTQTKSDSSKKQLEEIVKAVKQVKKEKQPEKQVKYREIKTNYNTAAEIYKATKKTIYHDLSPNKPETYESEEEKTQIKTQTPEQLTYQDIERITKMDIANTILGLGKWNNISPHEREDYENWKKLAPGAKMIWWMLVQDSGFGNRDIAY